MLAIVASCLPACGDPGDAQVPLPLGGRSPVAMPAFERVDTRAFANIRIEDPDGGGVCPIGFGASLGPLCGASAPDPCTRLLERDWVAARCEVRARVDAAGVDDVDLQLQHALLSELAVRGPLSESDDTHVTLGLVAPDGARVDATCVAEAFSTSGNDAYFRLLDCTDATDTPGCGVSLVVRFETCVRE